MYDLREVKKQNSFELIPNGTYLARVMSAELRDTKAGTGKYINCTIVIVGGEFDGRRLWERFNVENPNPQAVEIGMQQLKSMMLASGLAEEKCVIKDVTDLEGMSFGIVVGVKEDQNVIKRFESMATDTMTPASKSKATKSSSIPW